MSAPHHNRHGHHHGDDHEHSDGHRHAQQAGIRALLASVFTPHSHHPVGAVDTALATSEQGLRALRISLAALVTTAVAQLAVVMVSGSVALLADTVHNFADALTAVPLGVAFWLGRRPSTRRYTYGYGRAEDLAGIVIVATVALSAVVAAWQAVDRLVHPRAAHNVGWVIAAGVIGAIGNELVADGLHARTDGLTSLAVVLGAIGVAAGAQVADPIVGLVITVAILLVLNDAARDIYRRLMDSVEPGWSTPWNGSSPTCRAWKPSRRCASDASATSYARRLRSPPTPTCRWLMPMPSPRRRTTGCCTRSPGWPR